MLVYNFFVEEIRQGTVYRISGNGAPQDLEVRIRAEQGKFKAEANYTKKPSNGATGTWQPSRMHFDTAEKALENILKYFDSSKEPFVKVE